MSMKDRERPSETAVALDIPFEIYLKGREDPVTFITTYEIPTAVISDDSQLNDVMQVVIKHVLATIDTVAEHRLLLSDRRENKFICLTSEIASISILAPDKETILAAMEQT